MVALHRFYFTVCMLQDQILSVCLTDTNSNEDIHINDLLVHEGYALFCPDTNETLHSAHLHQQEVNQSAIPCIVQSIYNAMFGAHRYQCVINESCYKGKFSQGGYSHFVFICRLGSSIYPSPPKNIRNFKHPKKRFEL